MQQLDSRYDGAVLALAQSRRTWARLPLAEKIAMLEAVQANAHRHAREWAQAGARAKGLAPGSPLAGEEWISGPWAVLYAIRRYLITLRGIAKTGEPPLPPIAARADGRLEMTVYPHDLVDRAMLIGVRARIRMRRGVTAAAVRANAGSFYKQTDPQGSLVLILGAGNISSIAPLDMLYKLFAEGCVCMLKLNPVNDYLQTVFERVFDPLVRAGFVAFASGGAEMGAYLCAHPSVGEVHITGSEATHRAVARAAGGKRLTSELGNVSPTIVIPGEWSVRDLEYQAQNIATQKAHNAGFNCISSQVLILQRGWKQAAALKQAVANVLESMEQRPEYYPGARERRTLLVGNRTELRPLVDADPDRTSSPVFKTEAFCGVLACVELPGGTEEYVRNAVAFANGELHGTLGANIIVDPKTARTHREAIDTAIDDLRYGCVAVNAWTGVGYFLAETPWGAYPGHTVEQPGSGLGVVHNAYFLQDSEKSIITAPFFVYPRPPWFVTNRAQDRIGEALCNFEVARSPLNFARVLPLAFRG